SQKQQDILFYRSVFRTTVLETCNLVELPILICLEKEQEQFLNLSVDGANTARSCIHNEFIGVV
ncbi:MAG TPA: hypothetical protein V6C85_29760, partial [Allocoleopsis sp.]